jgi:hypothetical protein
MSSVNEENEGMLKEDFNFNSPDQSPPSQRSQNGPVEYAVLQGADLIRTQVHLTPLQRKFLNERAAITGKSMALQIRELIDKEMNPDHLDWTHNPLLDDPVADREFESRPLDSQNSDAAIYGSYQG